MANNQTTDRLMHNLTQSLNHLRATCALLEDIEGSIVSPDPEDLERQLALLQRQQATNESFTSQRMQLLEQLLGPGCRPRAVEVTQVLAPNDRPRARALFDDLKTALHNMLRLRERVWTMLRVRVNVVETTLGILTGGTSRLYGAGGEPAVSSARPILQRRC